MAFCQKCGATVEEGAKFCPVCGATIGAAQQSYQQPQQQTSKVEDAFNQFNNTEDNTCEFDPADIEQNKIMAVLAYLSWLVLIPIFAAKESRFARFHVNQGLALAIAEIVWGILYNAIRWVLPYGFFYNLVGIIGSVVYLLFAVVSIIGIINAVQGKAKKLPLIGNLQIIK